MPEGLTESLTAALDARAREVEAVYREEGPASGPELEFRAEAKRRAAEEAAKGAYAAALGVLRDEEGRARDRRRLDLVARVTDLKDRLWVGEKLGLDTTPVMERFSEAQLAITERPARGGARESAGRRGPPEGAGRRAAPGSLEGYSDGTGLRPGRPPRRPF